MLGHTAKVGGMGGWGWKYNGATLFSGSQSTVTLTKEKGELRWKSISSSLFTRLANCIFL